ncbi:MAG: Slp family lipoprotein [Nitrospirae bacterium]|nr:Slp family lipoprotein [Nitrospirota bacterium]
MTLCQLAWPVLVFLLTTGCISPAISRDVRNRVDPAATFKAVFHDPDSQKGKIVLWGGEIIRTRNTKEATWIELLQHPLDGNDRPIHGAVSEGRFLIRHEGFLDPAVYGSRRELTVAGEVQGRQTRTLDEADYAYPVVADQEMVLWGPRQEPTFHLGLGFGATFSR